MENNLYLKSFDNLVNNLSKLPTIGQKTAQRLACFLLKSEKSLAEELSNSILNAKNTIKNCKICHNYSENEICKFCSNVKRNPNIVCVVEDALDIINIEKINNYKGVYHVLDGVISIQKGIGPNNLNTQTLFSRVQNNKIEEIIIATNPTLDGDSTALYLKKKIQEIDENVKVTRLAMGLPSGSSIEYTDNDTLARAFSNRIAI